MSHIRILQLATRLFAGMLLVPHPPDRDFNLLEAKMAFALDIRRHAGAAVL